MQTNRNTLGNARADELKINLNNLFIICCQRKDLSNWKIHIYQIKMRTKCLCPSWPILLFEIQFHWNDTSTAFKNQTILKGLFWKIAAPCFSSFLLSKGNHVHLFLQILLLFISISPDSTEMLLLWFLFLFKKSLSINFYPHSIPCTLSWEINLLKTCMSSIPLIYRNFKGYFGELLNSKPKLIFP